MYWMALNNTQYQGRVDSIAKVEKENIELQKITVDFVAPGEQQPEADHFIQQKFSSTGNSFDEFWRDAKNEGFFSYELSTQNETNLALMVRYFGGESGNRKFDIYIDDEKLTTVDNTRKWTQQQFQTERYAIPESMVKGKSKIRVKFQALAGNTAGPIYYLRLLRP